MDAIADINGDGILDAMAARYYKAFRDYTGTVLGNGDGTFGPFLYMPPYPVLPPNVLVADMNGDGKPDLVFPWYGGIAVMLNTTAQVSDYPLLHCRPRLSPQGIR